MNNEDRVQQFRQRSQAALSLNIAYIGVVNGLFAALRSLATATPAALARAAAMDEGYVRRWCDAAYAFEYLDADGEAFSLTANGAAMVPGAEGGVMPMAIQSVLTAHMAERAAALMRTGERPGESVLAERQTLLPWFGPMLEANFAPMFENTIVPAVPAFAEIDRRGGLAVDLGCGNGWYLRALARRCRNLRGLGLDGFAENVSQAQQRADAEGLGDRVRFSVGDIRQFTLDEPADLVAMNRALHHVWEEGREPVFQWFRDNVRPGGFIVIWEPAWPAQRSDLRDPSRRAMAFQNLGEHVQGNHFLRPQEIVDAFAAVDMPANVHLFAGGNEAVIVARR